MGNSRTKLGRTQRLAARKAKWLAVLAKAEVKASAKDKPCRDHAGVLPAKVFFRVHSSPMKVYSEHEHANRQKLKGVFDQAVRTLKTE